MSGWADIRGAGGSASNLSWTARSLYTPTPLPTARVALNGQRPIIIDQVQLYMAGRYEYREVRLFVRNEDGSDYQSTGPIGLPHEYPVANLRGGGLSKGIGNAVGQTIHVGVESGNSNLVVYGKNPVGGGIHYRDFAGSWMPGDALAGRYGWAEVPTPARSVGAQALDPTRVRVTWGAPSDGGGYAISGYRVQWSKASNFSSGVGQRDVAGNARSTDVTGLTPGTWYFRVLARNAVAAAFGTWAQASNTASAVLALPTQNPGDLDGWTTFGALPANMQGETTAGIRRTKITIDGAVRDGLLKRNYVISGSATLQANTHGLRRTITGLTVGKVYRFRAQASYVALSVGTSSPNIYQLGVEGIGWAEEQGLGQRGRVYTLPTIEFVATETSHVVAIRLTKTASRTGYDEMENTHFFNLKVEEVPSGSAFRLQSLAYEGSLLNHFDIACNSVGARWYVDQGGTTRFIPGLADSAVVATFTDERADGELEYVGISRAFDTRDIVNDLDVQQHGAKLDGGGGWATDDYTVNYVDLTSAATYGPRRASLDTSLYDQGIWAGSVAQRAADILEASSVPAVAVTGIRWNAQENPGIAAQLEIYARVNVRFRGELHECRVVGMKHNLTPNRWMIDLYLIEGA